MSGVPALPFVHRLSQSGAAERALVLRLCRDLLTQGRTLPESLAADLEACLAQATEAERMVFLKGREPTRDAIQDILESADPERLLNLACDPLSRLRAEHIAALVPHALAALARDGDLRLARAVLAREPIRLEAAPLFLEATPEQRRALLLAAQRAELGRRAPTPPRLDPVVAEGLEFAAIAGEREEFAEALADALGLDRGLAARIAADPDGEPLAVALAALGAPQGLMVRILTGRDLSEGGQGLQRVHALARLGDRLSTAAARRILAALVGQSSIPTPAAPAAPPRQAAEPSPFLRREGFGRRVAAIPETSARSAQNSRRP